MKQVNLELSGRDCATFESYCYDNNLPITILESRKGNKRILQCHSDSTDAIYNALEISINLQNLSK